MSSILDPDLKGKQLNNLVINGKCHPVERGGYRHEHTPIEFE